MYVDRTLTLEKFIEELKTKFNLKKPTIASTIKGIIYIPGPPSLEQHHHHKLALTFNQLIEQGHIVGAGDEKLELMDSAIPSLIYLKLVFNEMMTD
jgi:hypothetical protein